MKDFYNWITEPGTGPIPLMLFYAVAVFSIAGWAYLVLYTESFILFITPGITAAIALIWGYMNRDRR